MRIVIVGAGSIGLLVGAHLLRGGHEALFVETRRETVEAINQQGIGLIGLGGANPDAVTMIPAKACTDAREIAECDGVILAVKSFDTIAAMQAVAHLITANSPVLTLQTGLGNLEAMEKVERRKNILGGFTYLAGASFGPGRVRLGGIGKTYLGELDGSASKRSLRLCQAFNACGLETECVDRIVDRIWWKVIVYSAINAISAVLRVKNGRLLDKMESITLAKRMIDEGREVAAASGIGLDGADLYELFFQACQQTADNASSMLVDLVSERRTEIDALSGAIVSQGAARGVAACTHMTMVELVKLCEKWGPGPHAGH